MDKSLPPTQYTRRNWLSQMVQTGVAGVVGASCAQIADAQDFGKPQRSQLTQSQHSRAQSLTNRDALTVRDRISQPHNFRTRFVSANCIVYHNGSDAEVRWVADQVESTWEAMIASVEPWTSSAR